LLEHRPAFVARPDIFLAGPRSNHPHLLRLTPLAEHADQARTVLPSQRDGQSKPGTSSVTLIEVNHQVLQ
jgi:hypothetical protein